ncbi:MAG TPA: hypothetical protein VLA71_09715, partial [Algoriphagus sp.]|nr:hypothetical protein [Algoriphagus sp.]
MDKILTLVFLSIINLTFGQSFQNGLILPEKTEDGEICCIYAPKEGFEIYDNPNGRLIGRLTRNVEQNKGDQSYFRIYFVENLSKTEELIGLENFQEIAYEIWALTFNLRKDDFVRLKIQEKNFWIKEKDILKAGFKVTDWQ